MFDIGFWEIAVIGAIMLVVLGPERLPGVARSAGFWLSKIRRMVSDVKSEVKREMDAAELKELDDAKNQIQQASRSVHKQMNKDILADADIKGAGTGTTATSVSKDDSKTSAPVQQTPSEHSALDPPEHGEMNSAVKSAEKKDKSS